MDKISIGQNPKWNKSRMDKLETNQLQKWRKSGLVVYSLLAYKLRWAQVR